jgi:Kef-type K+ transport system membrane component KefB/nucleotide-binding universal stress UspA family protein
LKKFSIPTASGIFVLLLCAPAFAAAGKAPGGELGGSGEVILIAEIVLLLLVGRGLGEIMQRFGQPAIIGQLLAGLILGPSLFGWAWPEVHDLIFPKTPEQKNLIAGISDMGVMMLLLLTGMETDLKLVRKVGAPAISIAAMGVAIPFACGFALGMYLPPSVLPPEHRLVGALFLGTALSISSIKIVAMVVREMNFMRRNLGQIIVASAIMEDTVGWVIISITLGIAGAGGVALGALAATVAGTALFLVVSYTLGRKLVFLLIRWVNDSFASEYAVVTAILIVMCGMALITQAIGVNTVLGAFTAGVLVGESPILSQHIQDQLRGFITAFMMPIFFGLSGLSADLTVLKDPGLALLTLALIGIASLGKFAGAFTGGTISGLSSRESLALGCGMNARGSTEVIIASIGLAVGALTHNLYTMIVTMAVVTTMMMPPMLRWALARLPVRRDEKARLEKEDIDARGFVSRFERLLLAADESANGKFASRLVGFIAGQRGIPLTVLQLNEQRKTDGDEPVLKEVATDSASEGRQSATEEKGEPNPDRAAISARVEKSGPQAAVAQEAAKGYDILFIGIEKMRDADGTFSSAVDRATAGFEGPLALTIAGRKLSVLEAKGFHMLIPVNGTEASRRGAEMAFALAPAQESRVTVLYVAESARSRAAQSVSRRTEKAVLADITALAGRYGYKKVDTAVHVDVTPDEAILAAAENAGADMIVMGASRRVGKAFYLGHTVARVLQKWKGTAVLVGS